MKDLRNHLRRNVTQVIGRRADSIGVIQVRDVLRRCQGDGGLSPDLISLAPCQIVKANGLSGQNL